MRKGKIFIALGLCLFLFASSNVCAAESPITKTETFETESSDFKYDFQEEIELNGSKYKLNKTYYKVLSQMTSKVVNMYLSLSQRLMLPKQTRQKM